MTFTGEIDARFSWSWCADCGINYRLSDRARHFAKHMSRPVDGAMTLAEVRELLHKSIGELNTLVRTGRLKVIREEKRRRCWVTKEALVEYAEAEMKKGDLRMMQIITEKKKPQNWGFPAVVKKNG